MRTLLTLVVAVALLGAGAYAAQDFVEGQDFVRVSAPGSEGGTSENVKVVEFFWYGCPHCYNFEPYVDDWLKEKPEHAKFERIPAVLRPSWAPQARAFYALKLMGKLDQAHSAIFQAIHAQGRRLDDLDSLASFVAQQGVDEAEFRKAYNSLAVETRMQHGAQLARQYGVNGVPSVVVGGDYRSSGSQAGSYERLIEVVNYLVNKETG